MVLCIAVIAGLLCWFLRSMLKQKNQLGMMMGFGCVMVLIIQFLFIYAGKYRGIRARSECMVSVFWIWAKWSDGFGGTDGNSAEHLPASECDSGASGCKKSGRELR